MPEPIKFSFNMSHGDNSFAVNWDATSTILEKEYKHEVKRFIGEQLEKKSQKISNNFLEKIVKPYRDAIE